MKTLFTAVLGVSALSLPARAVIVGTTDTFQDLTVQGWGGANPINSASGGPAGAGDAFLQLTSTGLSGPNGKLAGDNADERWIGDYLAAGVTQIEADFLNLGTVPLDMRLVLFHAGDQRYTSMVASVLPVDGLWHHLVFAVDESSLTLVNGTYTYQELMTTVDNVMFRHQSGPPGPGGTQIASSVGIDNIHIAPAPGAAVLFALYPLMRRRSRRGTEDHDSQRA